MTGYVFNTPCKWHHNYCYLVPSEKGTDERYTVDLLTGFCSCPHHRVTKKTCKHYYAARWYWSGLILEGAKKTEPHNPPPERHIRD